MTSEDDHGLARRLVEQAGEALLATRARLRRSGATPTELKAVGDRSSHRLLVDALASSRPLDAVLSEEAEAGDPDGPSRHRTDRVWIIDPLDGTREYSEGRDDWAVHVALVEGGEPTAGAVALPAMGQVFSTPHAPAPPPAPPRLRIAVSRTRPPAEAGAIAAALGAELVPMGSAGAKAMAVLQGRVDIYPHSGGQYEWDSAAPVAVARSAGLHCSRLDGSPLVYNGEDPWLPDLLVCRPEHADAVLAALEEV